jgi:hypothetical protein
VNDGAAYAVCSLLGGGVGLAELVSRYRDEPASLVKVPSAWVYVVINGGASAAALYLAHVFGWTFGATGSSVEVMQVLLASFAAIAFFRSSLFTARVGDTDVGVGPSTVLTTLLGAADRDVDRHRAKARSDDVAKVMGPPPGGGGVVSFDKARYALPTYVLGLLQNVPLDEQARLRKAVDDLAGQSGMTDHQKALSLGLLLMNIAGPDVVRSAVDALGPDIRA